MNIIKSSSWRKGQDSNLRGVNLPVFKTGAFNHSATLPCFIIAQVIEVGNFSDGVCGYGAQESFLTGWRRTVLSFSGVQRRGSLR